jgi:SAM domain (Sterile alpha motif)
VSAKRTSEISDWLEKLGMSEYVQGFAENGITADALRHLTDQDLKDIGVLEWTRRTFARSSQPIRSVSQRPSAALAGS